MPRWKPIPVAQRFWSKVEKLPDDGCWIWLAAVNANGYGVFSVGTLGLGTRRTVLAHRFAYEEAHGPMPDGRELDHICRTPACVRESHLEPVPHLINMRRGIAGAINRARQRAKTHCPKGHSYSGPNLYVDNHGFRYCKACKNDLQRREKYATKWKQRQRVRQEI